MKPRPRAFRGLAALPPLVMLGGVPWANGIRAYVLGLPFLLFWITAGVIATSATLVLVGALDRRRDREGG